MRVLGFLFVFHKFSNFTPPPQSIDVFKNSNQELRKLLEETEANVGHFGWLFIGNFGWLMRLFQCMLHLIDLMHIHLPYANILHRYYFFLLSDYPVRD